MLLVCFQSSATARYNTFHISILKKQCKVRSNLLEKFVIDFNLVNSAKVMSLQQTFFLVLLIFFYKGVYNIAKETRKE
jgi:hypothetical protein